MKKETKILLVYPPNQLLPIETPRPDGSLGPLYLAGALEDAGFETDILDASVGPKEANLENTFYRNVKQPNGLIRIGMSREQIEEYIARGGYAIVGINSNFTPQTNMALEVAAVAKKADPNILVIVGGISARNIAEYFLHNGNVDVVCLTEGEKIITRIARQRRHGMDFEQVPGVMYKKGSGYARNPVGQGDIHTNLDQLPFPAWHKLPFNHYDTISSPHGVLSSGLTRYAPMMTSRGCPFRCDYCHISVEKEQIESNGDIGSLRLKSIERVLEELGRLKALGVRKVYFEDDSLLAKKARVKAIFERVPDFGMEIADVNGVNLVHFTKPGKGCRQEIDIEYLELLKNAGFKQIVFPVESGSQRILDTYATGKLNLEVFNVVDLVRAASRIGITCPINMMIGFPDETEEEMMQSVVLGKKLVDAGAAYCTFFIPIPFPGSKLFQIAVANGYLDKNFDPDTMNWKNAVMKNTVVSPERIIELRDWAWREVNTEEHVAMRLKASMGARWQSNGGEVE